MALHVFQVVALVFFLVLEVHGSPALPPHMSRPLSRNPMATYSKARYFPDYASERVTVRYGRFKAPANSHNNGMQDFTIDDATMPCHNCLITHIEAGLVYPDGSYANADTGLQLHHVVLTNLGRESAVCGWSLKGDRFFASGNERTPVDICAKGADKTGYWLARGNKVAFSAELINYGHVAKEAMVTITYEYIPYTPPGFVPAIPIWLDIRGCGDSHKQTPSRPVFTLNSPGWTSSLTARLTSLVAHSNDGGVNIRISKRGKTICNSVAGYGENRRYISSSSAVSSRSDYGEEIEHISSMTTCHEKDWIKAGDELSIEATYDFTSNPALIGAGDRSAPIMGIALLYAAEPPSMSIDWKQLSVQRSSHHVEDLGGRTKPTKPVRKPSTPKPLLKQHRESELA